LTDEQVVKLDFEGWPLRDDYLIELGRIAALWGYLESSLNVCLGKLAGFDDLTDPTSFILLAHASFPQRIDMLGSLCEHLLPRYPTLKEYKIVAVALRDAQKLRNKYMHNGLSSDGLGQIQVATGSARGTLKFAIERISVADLRRVTMAIHRAIQDLYKLVFQREVPPVWEPQLNPESK
jgi:hypothetical protein